MIKSSPSGTPLTKSNFGLHSFSQQTSHKIIFFPPGWPFVISLQNKLTMSVQVTKLFIVSSRL